MLRLAWSAMEDCKGVHLFTSATIASFSRYFVALNFLAAKSDIV